MVTDISQLQNQAGNDSNKKGVLFLYKFDAALRTLLREYIERTEMFYKDLIGNEIAIEEAVFC